MPLLTDSGLAADIADAEAAIVAATGVDPKPWFRCPFGAGMDDPRVLGAIGAAGYRHVGWDVDVEDWEADRDASKIATLLVDGVLGRHAHGDPDSIVLLHSWPVGTGSGVALAIGRLREAGASFVRVDELLAA
jgi:peptidoglycan/xylan/chitin deacetylase (PgdA/CDA1 family)